MALPALAKEDPKAVGNYGLLDLVEEVRFLLTLADSGWISLVAIDPDGDKAPAVHGGRPKGQERLLVLRGCLLYTSDAADDRISVDLGELHRVP